MSTGKSAAQASHAAVEAFQVSKPTMVNAWNAGGHYAKIVLMAEDEAQLTTIREYIEERGFKTRMIIDEGRTEIKPFTKTALGVEIVDKSLDHVAETFGSFKTYKDLPPSLGTVPERTELALQVLADYAPVYLSRRGRKT